MKKMIPMAVAATMALSTIVAVATPASAATYKIKNNKLVNKKTGKVVTATTVFNNRLYKKGSLAKGTVLYKKVLYVNGKIKSGIVKHNNVFYKKGKAIAKNTYFLYNEKLYVNNALVKGMKKYSGSYYKNGKVFTGTYENNYYMDGELAFKGTVKDPYSYVDQHVYYSNDGATVTYEFWSEYATDFEIDLKKITVDEGATVKSVSTTENYTTKIVIENAKNNTVHTLKIADMKVNGAKLNFTTKVAGFSDDFDKKYNFTELNTIYNQYKDMKQADIRKFVKTAEGKAIVKKLEGAEETFFDVLMESDWEARDLAYASVTDELMHLFEIEIGGL